MNRQEITRGRGRTKINLSTHYLGGDLIVYIYNQNAHIGAVALGEYDPSSGRASTSVITRLGHKDDVIAQKAAYLISKSIKKPVCVIAGIHLDHITKTEINRILKNADALVSEFVSKEVMKM